jgi:hypothetical protein
MGGIIAISVRCAARQRLSRMKRDEVAIFILQRHVNDRREGTLQAVSAIN